MANEGVNGWHYNSIADYVGRNLALPICKNCAHLRNDKGTVGTFGDFIYRCTASTGCAAAQMGQGKMVSKCEEFEPMENESKSKGGGKKRPIWLRIICCPFCCFWHTLGSKLNFVRGFKKAYTW